MSVRVHVSGAAETAVSTHIGQLVDDLVASSITAQDPALWGTDAEAGASKRLGWTESVSVSRSLVAEIEALRAELLARGVEHIVLAGTGASLLAPELIAKTAGAELTVLDSAVPGRVQDVLHDRLQSAALVVSSTSGSADGIDSLRRVFAQAFQSLGIDPAERIVVVTDPGSPLGLSAREAGYRVFAADPSVGGRYSALTAFGLVPAGLAGADVGELLDEADAIQLYLATDDVDNPGLILGAAIAGTSPPKSRLGIVSDGTHVVGFGDWATQLIAGPTGTTGTTSRGLRPVVLELGSPELTAGAADLQIVRLVKDADAFHLLPQHRHEGEILVSGSLGGLLLAWEYAAAVAARLLGVDPFDEPDD
ncbi:hypothetical protein B7R25_07720 [Subtercola boreus]|uniref:Glucose-6-phosphate isomerase n=1 Tax=Subtercola boreus TaxID=120213 RepID=A0A3E0WB58_9MICO|nr:hypothetical protein B7R24_07650 [Subtercola boreus]RFA21631.1 hypothetical protein B7R23_07595 [Subtercola boreus]RFA27601.1 hypothetical protein B7R25_07720 [Subtercola boreus]